MTCHRASRPARTCPAVRPSACSLASMTPETGSPLAVVCASSSVAVLNGYGRSGLTASPAPSVALWGVALWSAAVWAAAVSPATKPPPTE